VIPSSSGDILIYLRLLPTPLNLMDLALTSSVGQYPAPMLLHMILKGRLLMPAIGLKDMAFFISMSPIFIDFIKTPKIQKSADNRFYIFFLLEIITNQGQNNIC